MSSTSQKPDLAKQRQTLEQFRAARGLVADEWIEEVGGGRNFHRKRFLTLVDEIVRGDIGILVIAHKDRLARFGYPLIAPLCETYQCELIVMNTEALSPEAEIAAYEQRQWRAYDQSNAEYDKCERYCRKQRELLRQLEDLKASERAMFELDHAKDQVMTTLKLALVNLVMWTRDSYFPATYAQATWKRLAPFFRLPGRIEWGSDTVQVDLRPKSVVGSRATWWNCESRVEAAPLRLPDERTLVLRIPWGAQRG